jgi:tetratricopeptide (TPR) repeat protein
VSLKTFNVKPSIIICLALAVVTFAVYWPMTHHDFILFDDQQYVTENPHVQAGLTGAGVVWAFTNDVAANWHPLTWLSHMADCDLFGLYAGGHHLINLLFHIANTLLLFLWLNRMTGALWRSAFVAAFFAWHPLHVESVAWVAERKDVLSTFFWLLTLMAYTRYAESMNGRSWREKSGNATALALVTCPPSLYYGLALFLFACGLMSKPMVVTLPFVLLLLDYWPLNRLELPAAGGVKDFVRKALRLVVEKIPFFALAAAGSVMTYLAQKTGGALWSLSALPPQDRLANAVLSYVRYISKTLWPSDLAIIYPYPRHWPVIVTIGCVLVLAAWTGLFLWRLRRNPYLAVGWFWFLGTLVPTIGLVQVGSQSMADRYMYIPSIGLFVLVVWGLNDFFDRWPERKKFLPLAGVVALAGCLGVTSIQLGHWQNSFSLFVHAIDVTSDNYVAYNSLGQAFTQAGRKQEAAGMFLTSVQIETNFPPAQFNLAHALVAVGRPAEALPHYEAAARLMPNDPDLRYDFGTYLLHQDKPAEASRQFLAALDLRPDFPKAHNALGWACLRQSKLDQAVAQFETAIRLQPDFAEAHLDLAFTLNQQGKTNEALPHFLAAVKFDPGNPEYRFNLGLALLDHHQPAAAAIQFAAEIRLMPNDTNAHYRLAQALQQQGKFAEAVPQYREALRLTPDFPEARAALAAILAAHPELKTSEPLDTAR